MCLKNNQLHSPPHYFSGAPRLTASSYFNWVSRSVFVPVALNFPLLLCFLVRPPGLSVFQWRSTSHCSSVFQLGLPVCLFQWRWTSRRRVRWWTCMTAGFARTAAAATSWSRPWCASRSASSPPSPRIPCPGSRRRCSRSRSVLEGPVRNEECSNPLHSANPHQICPILAGNVILGYCWHKCATF